MQNTNIEDHDIQSLISGSNIIFADLCKQQDMYLEKIIPKSKEYSNDDERDAFYAYVKYIETVIYVNNI